MRYVCNDLPTCHYVCQPERDNGWSVVNGGSCKNSLRKKILCLVRCTWCVLVSILFTIYHTPLSLMSTRGPWLANWFKSLIFIFWFKSFLYDFYILIFKKIFIRIFISKMIFWKQFSVDVFREAGFVSNNLPTISHFLTKLHENAINFCIYGIFDGTQISTHLIYTPKAWNVRFS